MRYVKAVRKMAAEDCHVDCDNSLLAVIMLGVIGLNDQIDAIIGAVNARNAEKPDYN